jgi:uncharacterized protein
MKLNGTHKFKANSNRVFNALLDPSVLKQCIPGCESVEQLDATRLQVNISTSLPGLKGPYGVIIDLLQRQDPSLIVLGVKRQGRGGSVDATAHLNLADQADGALLTYDANADLGGTIAVAANNPIGQGVVKNSLKSVFDNLEKALV